VIERSVQEGEMITSSNSTYGGEGSVIMKVADLSRMIVQSNINEVDIAKFKVGQAATIKVDALPYDEFTGRITKIAPMATTDNSAKVFPVEIGFDKVSSQLKPGMTGNVSIIGQSRKDVLVIPIRGVFTDDKNQDIVYLVKAGAAEAKTAAKSKTAKTAVAAALPQTVATPVKLGGNDLQQVEVIEGLKEGDKISLTDQSSSNNFNMMMGGF
jgi:HlyD family secretion protein